MTNTTKITCRDCLQPASPTLRDAIRSGRCNACQVERDGYYNDRMRQEHPRRSNVF